MENQSRPNESANLINLAAENNFPCTAHQEDINECAWLKDYEKLLYYSLLGSIHIHENFK